MLNNFSSYNLGGAGMNNSSPVVVQNRMGTPCHASEKRKSAGKQKRCMTGCSSHLKIKKRIVYSSEEPVNDNISDTKQPPSTPILIHHTPEGPISNKRSTTETSKKIPNVNQHFKYIIDVDGIRQWVLQFCPFPTRSKLRSLNHSWKSMIESITEEINFRDFKVPSHSTEVEEQFFTNIAQNFRNIKTIDLTGASTPKFSTPGLLKLISVYRNLTSIKLNPSTNKNNIVANLMLHNACKVGATPELLLSLIQQGAKVHCRRRGKSPIYTASMYQHTSVMRTLLKAGASIDEDDNGQFTMLQAASAEGDLEKITLLLGAGAWIDHRTVDGTALTFACRLGHRQVVKLLIDAAANADLQDSDGLTPLMHAAAKGYVGIIEMLQAAGANVTICDRKGCNALAHAVMNQHGEAVLAVLRSGGTN